MAQDNATNNEAQGTQGGLLMDTAAAPEAADNTAGEGATDGNNAAESAAEKLFGDQQAKGNEGEAEAPSDEADPSQQADKTEGEDDSEGDKSEGAPEEYDDFEAPEGVELDQEMTSEFKELAKEHGLDQKAAQRFMDLGVKQALKFAEQPKQVVEQARQEWEQQARNDQEFGGKNLDANLGVAKKALDQFGSPELNDLLRESALGNHPAVIRAFYRVGKAISEDTFVGGKTGAPAQNLSAAERLYGKTSN